MFLGGVIPLSERLKYLYHPLLKEVVILSAEAPDERTSEVTN
jgi:hypothetical protein